MMLVIGIVAANAIFLSVLEAAYLIVARRRLKIYILVEHLAALTRNRMPIHEGLRVIGRDLGGWLGSRLGRVAQRMEEGRSLSEAFQSVPSTFPPLLRSMMALGDRSGNLASFLEEMRKSYRRIADLPGQSMYAFLYPLLLSVCINLVLSGLFAGIVPKFETLFGHMNLSDAALLQWWPRLLAVNEGVLVLCIALVVIRSMGGISIHFGSSIGRRFKALVDRLVLVVPVLRKQVSDGAVQQFALCSGLFLRSGAPLAEAVSEAAAAERNLILRRRLERVARAVTEGSRLSAAMRDEGFESDLVWFLETGETSGLLADHLQLAAVHYESKARLAAQVVSRAIVPFFVVLNGLVVFGVFLLLFVPILEIQRMITR